MPSYHVVEETSLPNLERRVQEFQKVGWKTTGGVFILTLENRDYYLYHQAMTFYPPAAEPM